MTTTATAWLSPFGSTRNTSRFLVPTDTSSSFSSSSLTSLLSPVTAKTTAVSSSSLAEQQHSNNARLCGSFGLVSSRSHSRCSSNRHQMCCSTSSPTRLYLSSKSPSSSSNDDAQQNDDKDKEDEDEEWYPVDPASTTPQLLSGIWFLIVQAQQQSLVRGESLTIRYPQMSSQLNTPSYLSRLVHHMDVCKDVCDDFGTKLVLVPYYGKSTSGGVATNRGQQSTIQGFTVKSYRNPKTSGNDDDENDEYDFDYDPFWDDGDDDWNYEGIDDEIEAEKRRQRAAAAASSGDSPTTATTTTTTTDTTTTTLPDIPTIVPSDNDEIIDTTKVWVDKLMSDMGICPFTSGPDMAGLPLGPVFYTVDRCTSMESAYLQFWKEVVRVEQNNERDLSTTLLILPEFCSTNVEMFENFANTLTQALSGLDGSIEDLIQLVFFHPQWTFRDGAARSGVGAAANYARRSPWPMINILRTSQVRTAQRGIPTGLVYQQNERTLSQIGPDKLETMLRLRNWTDIADITVNRRDMEALRVAQDFQQTGTLPSTDTSFEHDSTPAANKVDRRQIDGANMVNVIRDALSKRLGKRASGSDAAATSTTPTPLSGPETSATVMASDFLLEELTRIMENDGPSASAAVVAADADATGGNSASNDEQRRDRMAAARQMIIQDMQDAAAAGVGGAGGSDDDRSQVYDEMDALFGGKGIPMTKKEDSSTGTDGGESNNNSGKGKFGAFY